MSIAVVLLLFRQKAAQMPLERSARMIIHLARASTTNVMMMNKQEAQCKQGIEVQASASRTRLPASEAMDVPGENSDVGSRLALPITECDGHRFTQRTSHAQHHATDDTPFCVRQHHLAHHLPSGTAQTVSRLAQDGGGDFKHIAHRAAMNGSTIKPG